MRTFFGLLILTLVSFFSEANESVKFQTESLLREGQADAALEFVKDKKINKADLASIKGQAYYIKGEWGKSLQFLKESVKSPKGKTLQNFIRISQLYLKLNRPLEAITFLKKIKKPSLKKDLLWSQSLWDQGNKNKAVLYLESVDGKMYEDSDLLQRQKAYYLFNLNKISKLFEVSKKYLKETGSSSEFGLYVVSLLKEKDRYLADQYFDLLLSYKGDDSLVLKERGVFLLEEKKSYLASLFLDRAAHLNSKYSFEAAAVHLDLGHHTSALFFNSRVKDVKKQVLQKFTIYLDSEDFEKALSMKHELKKRNLLKEDKISYALMYSAFKVKDYRSFLSLVPTISAKNYLSKVLKLKELVDSCRKSVGFECVFS